VRIHGEGEMKTIKAIEINGFHIVLSSQKSIEEVFNLIEKDENFILQWNKDGEIKSELMIASNISSKIKNGEIVLRSTEVKK